MSEPWKKSPVLVLLADFSWRRCALRSSLVAVMVLLGEAVPRFDLVMGLIGGSLTGPLMFVLPPLFYARLRRMSWRARLMRAQAAQPGHWQPERGAGKVLYTPLPHHSNIFHREL